MVCVVNDLHDLSTYLREGLMMVTTEVEGAIDIRPIAAWVRETVAEYRERGRPVESLGFERLKRVWHHTLLHEVHVCVLPEIFPIPVVPLTLAPRGSDGAPPLMGQVGVCYGDLYFLHADHLHDEGAHFQMLVQAAQWRLLGINGFLEAYFAAPGNDSNENFLEESPVFLRNLFEEGSLHGYADGYVLEIVRRSRRQRRA